MDDAQQESHLCHQVERPTGAPLVTDGHLASSEFEELGYPSLRQGGWALCFLGYCNGAESK